MKQTATRPSAAERVAACRKAFAALDSAGVPLADLLAVAFLDDASSCSEPGIEELDLDSWLFDLGDTQNIQNAIEELGDTHKRPAP